MEKNRSAGGISPIEPSRRGKSKERGSYVKGPKTHTYKTRGKELCGHRVTSRNSSVVLYRKGGQCPPWPGHKDGRRRKENQKEEEQPSAPRTSSNNDSSTPLERFQVRKDGHRWKLNDKPRDCWGAGRDRKRPNSNQKGREGTRDGGLGHIMADDKKMMGPPPQGRSEHALQMVRARQLALINNRKGEDRECGGDIQNKVGLIPQAREKQGRGVVCHDGGED